MASWEFEPDEAAVARYFGRAPLPVRVVAKDLDALVRSELPGARIGIKWGVPFYARKGPICYISAAKKHVTFGVVQGAHVPDASGLLRGTGKSPIRKATFPPGERVPRGVVRGWLKGARKLDRSWGQD